VTNTIILAYDFYAFSNDACLAPVIDKVLIEASIFLYLKAHLPFIFLGGRRTMNLVPLPTSLSKVTDPPKASAIRLTTDNPKP
jgi:hypothetical protein